MSTTGHYLLRTRHSKTKIGGILLQSLSLHTHDTLYILLSGTCDFEKGQCGWSDLSSGQTMWTLTAALNATYPDVNFDSTFSWTGVAPGKGRETTNIILLFFLIQLSHNLQKSIQLCPY